MRLPFFIVAIVLTAAASACAQAEKSEEPSEAKRLLTCTFPKGALKAEVDKQNHLSGKLHIDGMSFTREQVSVFSYEPGKVLAATAYDSKTHRKITVRAARKGDTKNLPAGASIELCKVGAVQQP